MAIPRFPIRCRIDHRLVHPGEILLDHMQWNDISQNALARAMGVPPRRINEIVLGKRSITPETAIELEDTLGLSAHFWLALQADYDIETLRMGPPRKPPKGRWPLQELGPTEPLEDPLQTAYDAIWKRSKEDLSEGFGEP